MPFSWNRHPCQDSASTEGMSGSLESRAAPSARVLHTASHHGLKQRMALSSTTAETCALDIPASKP